MKPLFAILVLSAGIGLKRCDPQLAGATSPQAPAVDSTYYQAQQAWSGTPPRLVQDTSCVHVVMGGNIYSTRHAK